MVTPRLNGKRLGSPGMRECETRAVQSPPDLREGSSSRPVRAVSGKEPCPGSLGPALQSQPLSSHLLLAVLPGAGGLPGLMGIAAAVGPMSSSWFPAAQLRGGST